MTSTTNTTGPVDDLRAFLDASPSPFHAAGTAAARLDAAGFTEVGLGAAWDTVPHAGYVAEGGSIVAWRHTGAAPLAGFRLVGAHTDSPCLRVKPNPDDGAVGWRQLNVEVYGGILNNSWLDRDLGIAGRLTLADGTSVLVDVREGIARVPQLAVHLDRGVNDGLKLDPQQHLRPVWGVGSPARGGFAGGSPAAPAATCPCSGTCACTTCSRPRCSAPTVSCSRAGGSTTSCRAGRPSTRSSRRSRATASR